MARRPTAIAQPITDWRRDAVVVRTTAKVVALPGSGRRKSIEAMTTVELETLVGGLATPPAATDVPIEKVVQGVRFKVAALGAAADVMVTRIDEVDRRVAREIRAELMEVLGRIDTALQG